MKGYSWILVLLFFISGCATFKELQPDPELSRIEGGYIELKNGKGNFELDKDKKYFIKVPPSMQDRFYVVLVTRSKPLIHSYFTNTFDDGKGPLVPIIDESISNDSTSVYAIDNKSMTFYWVIDTVRQDLNLSLRYRYVPRWRYTFENKYAEYKSVLADNIVDRSTYNAIDPNFNFDAFDFKSVLPLVETRTRNLNSVKDELVKLAGVFPPDIAASKDTAYENYVVLKSKVDDELTFQENYSTVLSLFKKEMDTRGDMDAFLESVPYFTSIVLQHGRFPAAINTRASNVFLGRLASVEPYIDNIIRRKSDITKITPVPSSNELGSLYQACGQQMPGETESIVKFIGRFNVEVDGLNGANAKHDALRSYFATHNTSGTGSLYAELVARAADLKGAIPESQLSRFSPYGGYNCATMLGRELTNSSIRASDLLAMYQNAQAVSQYLTARSWAAAESRLHDLFETRGFTDNPDITTQRGVLVKRFENDIFEGVKSASQQRIDTFIAEHSTEIDNVPQLYADSAFLPVHQLSFSSTGQPDLMQKRKQIDSYLEGIKYNKFPESSIKNIYAEFSRNSRDRGVEKARAIVEHGKFYKGSDKQVKGLITECDVQAAKWVIKPAEYRKLFALPVTSNKQGVNEYMFRVQLKIPSDAQFPVFDINLKLPQEVAEKSGQEQWYESITIDKKPLKNEGRFRVTSPTALNNYEALITPVQMDKEGRNILEVRFKYPGFRVFEVSTMAQVPIIRKN